MTARPDPGVLARELAAEDARAPRHKRKVPAPPPPSDDGMLADIRWTVDQEIRRLKAKAVSEGLTLGEARRFDLVATLLLRIMREARDRERDPARSAAGLSDEELAAQLDAARGALP